MRKILLLLFLMIPLLSAAQGNVYNKDGQLVYKYDGQTLYGENSRDNKWEPIFIYKQGYIYQKRVTTEDELILVFNGRELLDGKDQNKVFATISDKYVYFGDTTSQDAILGCRENNKYYRGKVPAPDKLVFSIEGRVPIAMLLFLNMAKR